MGACLAVHERGLEANGSMRLGDEDSRTHAVYLGFDHPNM